MFRQISTLIISTGIYVCGVSVFNILVVRQYLELLIGTPGKWSLICYIDPINAHYLNLGSCV